MKVLKGKKGAEGYACGPVILWEDAPSPQKRTAEDTEREKERLKAAVAGVLERLEQNIANAGDKAGADILRAQSMMLLDEVFLDGIRRRIENETVCAEYAIYLEGEKCAAELIRVDDEYLKARAEDYRDIAAKLWGFILGTGSRKVPDEPSVIVANEITPEEISGMDRTKVLAFACVRGNPASHSSILAGIYGIPYVFGIDYACDEIKHARAAAVDTDIEALILSPDREMEEIILKKKQDREELLISSRDYKGRVKVYANIAGPEDAQQVLKYGADGVGLFRTEFLYMKGTLLPGEDEQFLAYSSVLEKMGERPVIIRTMDVGADKPAECLRLKREENPALGRRAIRLCIENPEMFRTQLRAILRAARIGNAQLMFPMIASLWELDFALEQLSKAEDELKARNEAYRVPPIGMMIEVPSAAILSDIFIKKVDFFSIGTNDLTQYTLAADRQGDGLSDFFIPDHEAIIRLIKTVIKNAHREGKPVGICGELGSDPELIPLLYEMGIDELSMAPPKIPGAKAVLSGLTPKNGDRCGK